MVGTHSGVAPIPLSVRPGVSLDGARHLDRPDGRDHTDQVITELIRHSVAEEQYLHSAVRQHVQTGIARGLASNRSHIRRHLLQRSEQPYPRKGSTAPTADSTGLGREIDGEA
jgi:hypothetical protein